jgi:hypothetical protein
VIAFGFQNNPLEGAAMGKITFRFDPAKHGTVAKAGTSTATLWVSKESVHFSQHYERIER